MQRSDLTEFSMTDFKEILSTCSSELEAAVQNGAFQKYHQSSSSIITEVCLTMNSSGRTKVLMCRTS